MWHIRKIATSPIYGAVRRRVRDQCNRLPEDAIDIGPAAAFAHEAGDLVQVVNLAADL